MRGLTDGRLSIRAEASAETEDLRELTGNRHRQDSEHVRYLREHGDADTPASDLLGRDGTQPAPNPRRNVSEAGVPGVLPRPDQPGGTSSNRLTIHPERKIDETRHPKLANWAPAEEPEEASDATTNAPEHRAVPTTPRGNSEAQEVTGLARKNVPKAPGQFKVQSAAAAEPPATGSPEPTSELKRPFDDTGLAGEDCAAGGSPPPHYSKGRQTAKDSPKAARKGFPTPNTRRTEHGA